jgi:ABC-type cobalt transport system substrate-binding protein
MTTVLALDLASISGWAVGEPGREPEHGSIRFASVGASHEAVFAGAFRWAINVITEHQPTLIVWEAPLPTSFSRGRTTSDVTSLLFGLPAIIGCVAYQLGIYDIRKADTRDVRNHFIGRNPKRAEAKKLVMSQCRQMGWFVTDDNEADACAVWSYMCSLLNPKLAVRPTPLFGRRT